MSVLSKSNKLPYTVKALQAMLLEFMQSNSMLVLYKYGPIYLDST